MTGRSRGRSVRALLSLGLVACSLASASAAAARAPRRRGGATTSVPASPRFAALPLIVGTDASVLAKPGPYAVGVRTISLPGAGAGASAEVWYPVAAGTTGDHASYPLIAWLPEAARTKLGATAGPIFETTALRDAAPLDGGPFPLVVFSHGFGGYRVQSSFLTIHLASWGFLVAAPDHHDRDLAAVLSRSFAFESKDVEDLRSTVKALVSMNARGGVLAGRVDAARLIAIGHSAGANAALRWAAADASVMGVVALAGGAPSVLGTVRPALQPVLYMTGANDGVITAASVTGAYDASRAPRRLITLAASGHLAFADVCTIGRGEGGLPGLATQLGIEVPAALRALGTDGCNPPNAPVEQAWPVIRLAVTAELRTILGAGIPGFGLDQATLDALHTTGAVASTFRIG